MYFFCPLIKTDLWILLLTAVSATMGDFFFNSSTRTYFRINSYQQFYVNNGLISHWSPWTPNSSRTWRTNELSTRRRQALEQAASIFRSNINFAADPCANFYDYTCGNHKGEQTVWDNVFEQNFRRFSDHIERSYYDKRYLSSLWKTKVFYKKCLSFYNDIHERLRRTSEIVQIVDEFTRQTGFRMTIFNRNQASQVPLTPTTLGRALGFLSSTGVDSLLTPLVYADWMRPNEHKLYIDQSTLFWPRSSYIEPNAWNVFEPNYANVMLHILKEYGRIINVILPDVTLNQHVQRILQLEKTLARYYMIDEVDRRNYSRMYNPYYRNHEYPFVDFKAFFDGLSTNNRELRHYFHYINGDFIVMEPELLNRLSRDLHRNFDPYLVINYLFFRLIASRSLYLPYNNFGSPRENCARQTLTLMKYTNARIFLDSIAPNPRKRRKLERMVKKLSVRVVASYYKMLRKSLRRDAAAVSRAAMKIRNLTLNVGVPPIVTSNFKLEAYYNKLRVFENESFIQLREELQKFNIQAKFQKLARYVSVDRKLHCGEAAAPNSWFDYARNSLTVPFGMFVHPFYDPRWPASINYGSLAATVGHEVSHGFDDVGRQFNQYGQLSDWLGSEAKRIFDKTTLCVIRKYSRVCPLQEAGFRPVCLNGRKAAIENIADIAGLIVAWDSYRNLEPRFKKEYIRLPGAEFSSLSHDQLFFISFAQPWCRAKPSKKTLLSEILEYQHSPPEYRVITALQNFLPFRHAFNCPNASRKKPRGCGVWG